MISADDKATLQRTHDLIEDALAAALNVELIAKRRVIDGTSPEAIAREFEACVARFIEDVSRIGNSPHDDAPHVTCDDARP